MRRDHRLLSILGGTALAIALSLAPAWSDAGLGEGDAAVEFEGKEFVNTEPVSLKGLRGRLVLLELFSTT